MNARAACYLALTACGTAPPATPPPPSGPPPRGLDLPEITLLCPDELDIVPGCFVPVPAGTAWVGAQATDPTAPAYDDLAQPGDGPPRQVEGPALWVMATEATLGMYSVCQQAGACSPWAGVDPAGDPATAVGLTGMFPVRELTWDQARALCAYVGGRLPTGDEWERAARGGDGRRFAWGDGLACPYQRPADAAAGRADAVLATCAPLKPALAELRRPEVEALGSAIARWTDAEVAGLCDLVRDRPPADGAAALRRRVDETFAHAAPSPCDVRGEVVKAIRHEDHHPWRLRALSAQVAEWTADVGEPPDHRLVRGGSFLHAEPADWRLAARRASPTTAAPPDVGVRCVRDTPPAVSVGPDRINDE
jgi:formylglycine-generating enzyme required for sulfatase activity